MISVWWAVLIGGASVLTGMVVMAALVAGAREDRRAEYEDECGRDE